MCLILSLEVFQRIYAFGNSLVFPIARSGRVSLFNFQICLVSKDNKVDSTIAFDAAISYKKKE